VTCTASPATFEKYRPTFESILASMRVPAPIASGINWTSVLNQATASGIAGGVVGALVAAFAMLTGFGKKRKTG
jgi:hypothetical protein